jgi:8-oxo-dGTP pyrophosphatase MutT (NUDIX family)
MGIALAAAKPSAVLVPVFRDEYGDLRLVLVARGTMGVHGGQMSLPGGKQERRDRSLLETALREAEEEIGLNRVAVDVLAALPPIYAHTTGFLVHPFLARVTSPRRWRLAAGEIRRVVTPRLEVLAEPIARRTEVMAFSTWTHARPVGCIVLEDGERLWGLTLRLVDAVIPRLLAGEWRI